MKKNNPRTATVALTALTVLLTTGCGLKDDLYMPATETETSSADTENTNTEALDAKRPDTDNIADEAESARSPEPPR